MVMFLDFTAFFPGNCHPPINIDPEKLHKRKLACVRWRVCGLMRENWKLNEIYLE